MKKKDWDRLEKYLPEIFDYSEQERIKAEWAKAGIKPKKPQPFVFDVIVLDEVDGSDAAEYEDCASRNVTSSNK